MKNIMKTLSHMMFWATSLLLCWALYDSQAQMIWYALATAVLAGISYWMRVKINKMWVFIVSHLAGVAGGVGLILILQLKIWYIGYLVLLALWSIILRCVTLARKFDQPGNLYLGFAASFHVIILIVGGNELAKGVSLCATILLFLLNLLYDNLQSADWFIEVRNLSEDGDARKASRVSKQISLLYTGGIGIILGLFTFVSMDGVWQAIKTGLYRLMGYLVRLLPLEDLPAAEEEIAEEGEQGLGMLEQMMEESERSLFAVIFDTIVPIALTIVVIVVVIALMIKMVKGMYHSFYQKRAQEDDNLQVEKLKADKRVSRAKRRQNMRQLESNATRRIRKIYKKNMYKLGEQKLRDFPYMTPDEQVQKHKEVHSQTGDVTEVRDIYEKARYGKEMVTDADVERMRTIM